MLTPTNVPFLFLLFVTVLFVFLGFIWSRKGWTNTLIKLALWVSGGWGMFLILLAKGYIVKAG